MSHLTER